MITAAPGPCRRSVLLRLVKIMGGILLFLVFVAGASAQETGEDPFTAARQATVFLMQTYEDNNVQVLSCVGSGTVISADGLILTNAHLAQSVSPCRGDRIIVALPVRLNEPPVPTYIAQPVQIDDELDIAVLQITGGLDNSPLAPDTLNLPFVSIGDPSGLLPGNGLTFVGYQDLGATSVSAISAVITGITAEKSGSRSAWFRTDVELGGGISGGGAYNSAGQLVGIPTSAPSTDGIEPGPTCLSIQDNTQDGLITSQDTCVPIGGNVTATRPIVYARPLIEAAQNGFRLDHRAGIPSAPVTDQPTISRIYFSPQVSEQGLPTRIVSDLPSGATSVFMFFDYSNMTNGIPYEVRVTQNSIDRPQFSLGPLAWGGGVKGTWFVGTEGKTWPDGQYEFTVSISGQAIAAATLQIGGSQDVQYFSDLSIGLPDGTDPLSASSVLLPAGISEIAARFTFNGMHQGQDWTEVWHLGSAEVYRATYLWDRESDGQTAVSAINLEGLPMGRYQLDLYIGSRLAATGTAVLGGNAGAGTTPVIFFNNILSSEISHDGDPDGYIVTSGGAIPAGISSLYSFVDWESMPAGTEWTYRWFLDGRLVGASSQRWDAASSGEGFWMGLQSDQPLPEGQYAVEVLVENRPMFSANLIVGAGTQPLSGVETEPDEVLIQGYITDALTGEAIAGALIIVLDVRFESPDFEWNEAQIHTQAISDRDGHFDLPKGLSRGSFYTFYVFAEGYLTLLEDNFTIPRTQPSPSSIVVEMARP